ncbi:MAG: hypothetical protein RIM84_03180 [Alphaproteobacteria bacterium]
MSEVDKDGLPSEDWLAETANYYKERARKRGPLTPAQLRWAKAKDRFAILLVFVFLAIFGGMMFDTAIRNGQCDVIEFVTFKCNRWNVEFKHWDEIDYRK